MFFIPGYLNGAGYALRTLSPSAPAAVLVGGRLTDPGHRRGLRAAYDICQGAKGAREAFDMLACFLLCNLFHSDRHVELRTIGIELNVTHFDNHPRLCARRRRCVQF